MTKTELNTFRKTLETKQIEIGNVNRDALTIETSPDELDRIQCASDRDYAIGNLERNSSRLREVRTALQRIDMGTFGICINCDENINPKRLAAVPWASCCLACQEDAERRQKAPQSEIDASFVMTF